jgi:cytoskeletal protein RodZ
MKTKTIGEILREERVKHHLQLDELSQRTRIRKEYLQALEENAFSILPSATFVKGYIKTYANLFQIDHTPLLALLRRDYKESAVGTLVPREFIKPALKKRVVWTPITYAILGMGAVFLTLMTYIAIQWYNIQKPPKLVLQTPEENAFVSAQIKVQGETVPDAIVSVNSQPVAIQPTGEFETEVYLPREGIHILTVEAVDRRGKKSVVQRSIHVRF